MIVHIKNGHLIDPQNKRNGAFDLIIEKGRIADVIKSGKNYKESKILDAKGLIVSPGFVDIHTHLREPGFEYKETIESGTESAACGGFTSICAMANTNPVNDQAQVTNYIVNRAKEVGKVRVYPIGAVTKNLDGKELAAMGELKEAGCVAFSDDGKCVDNAQMMRLGMEYAHSFALPIISHALCSCLGSGVMNESFVSTKLGLVGIPNQAEDTMVARDIMLAELTGARLHIAHLSTKGSVELVKAAKKKGLKVTAEVTPHHLFLTDQRIKNYDTNAKMAPPLRSEEDRRAVLKALSEGIIDAIATDHAPHAIIEKEVEFDQAAFGIVGFETALGLAMSFVHAGELKIERMIAALTTGPAKIFSLPAGSLEVGALADITLFDPKKSWIVKPELFRSKSKNTPFGGIKLKGKVAYTLVGGEIVYQDI
ncbi:MAG: dihydroorotase [Deltaproteobacteria bacterium RIFCSPLOWO2_12_FULL_40_28]|nr:MAG: dihydroorotase [Deltaproteobacteria bacterium RIFCSPHIGHO2_02_FULL_40_28]OGQ20281.1 MAG: dihydroorotase [Deltaproteobacteria bacterium RIFCSPHIGHO2_12_FULL_40_32]OGQ40392.1 MAG: dihydroorotase [Deltaproteobacteria bacterium RIFCSPLOWO2_02_FULL_40_36]OGQ54861.1 MAG: dihydroorotase [Deltaproteobacteria bacterium RIFCSPLOWO2_12_FULL_40_28]